MDILSFFRSKKEEPQPTRTIKKIPSGRKLAGNRARQTIDSQTGLTYGNSFYLLPQQHPNKIWRIQSLDDQTLDRISVPDLIDLMVDVSPEISKAYNDYLRFCNPGYEVDVLNVNNDDQNQTGLDAVNEMIKTLDNLHGSFKTVIARLYSGPFLRGAFMAELVLDENGRDFVDLATPDPASAVFERINDPVRGQIWKLGQMQEGAWVDLSEYDTIRFVPIDQLINNPHGRAKVTAAISSALFALTMLHDLRRVIAQQGYPRIDIAIILEKLIEAMPADAEGDPEKMQNWINEIIDEVSDVYESLKPDDTYVHTDVIEINKPVGTLDSSSLGAVDGLFRALDRMITRGVKSTPLLMGSNEAVSETHANRQWEIYVADIKSLQHYCETLLNRLFELALQAQGILARVEFKFAELRASEMLRDAQTEAILISNETAKYNQGWTSQDAASEAITGSPADIEAPRIISANQGDIVTGEILDGEEVQRLNGVAKNGSSST